MGRADTSRNSRRTTQQGASQKRQAAGRRQARRRRQRQTPLWPLAIVILVNVAILGLIWDGSPVSRRRVRGLRTLTRPGTDPISAQPAVESGVPALDPCRRRRTHGPRHHAARRYAGGHTPRVHSTNNRGPEALGLSADEVEQFITVPLEQDLLNGVAFLDEIESASLPGL